MIATIGVCYAGVGDHEKALEYFAEALAINREHGFRALQGNNLHHMGDSYAALGDRATARERWQEALVAYRESQAIGNLDNVLARLAEPEDAFVWVPVVRGPSGRG